MCKNIEQLQELISGMSQEEHFTLYDCLKGNERMQAYKAIHIHRVPEVTIGQDEGGHWMKAISRYRYTPLINKVLDHLETVIASLHAANYFTSPIGEYVDVEIFNMGDGLHDYAWINQNDEGTFTRS